MRILADKKGWSVIEVVCITGITIMLTLILIAGIKYLGRDLNRGNDSMMVQTAESVARMDLSSTDCVVSSCKDKVTCTHKTSDGYTVGYYDTVTHHILAVKPKGYNEHGIMYVGSKSYKGARYSMVIKVKGKTGGDIQLSWVEGDND